MSEPDRKLDDAFKSTFKVIFGECNLELDELKPYLQKYHYPTIMRKSAISGKNVALASERYPENAKFISQDEVDYGKRFELDINGIKDIDSIIGALGDRFYYTGNKVFGKSAFVQESDGCFDSFHVRDSLNVEASKYVAYSSYVRGGSEYVFGSSYLLADQHMLHCSTGFNSSRCFESYYLGNSSDLFFCSTCIGCTHAMFSFNLRSKKYAIGNLELPKDKYMGLRKKLVDESREYLEKHKDFYSIFDYSSPMKTKLGAFTVPEPKDKDMSKIEDAWKSTCRIVFGKELGKIDDFSAYLNEGNRQVTAAKSVFGNTIYPAATFFYRHIPAARRISVKEADQAAKLHIEIGDNETLKTILSKLEGIALYVSDYYEGECSNNIEAPVCLSATNTYRSDASFSKNVGYTVMAQHSESIFGSFRLLHSKFCVRCYHSAYLTRCFEVSDSSNCTDTYFSHNCENLDNCMFCFNTKSKRFAIGNVEVGRENYLKLKKLVLDGIVSKLEKTKGLRQSVYNIGSRQK